MSTTQIQPAKKLSNLQMELLKLYAKDVSDEDLLVIKKFLSKYFLDKAVQEANHAWDAKGYTEALMAEWRKTKSSDLKK